ncbi:maltooligosyl trehalose hydrolase [Brevibacterium sanguinis]|uniref:Malto-oligosyltrehalose trehalohydrolase n=2 Tax=Brevibacterium TaxID=1696 RepID=A0A366INB0_9MICO|nr:MULTISPECIES: malto-oligosyltrehalose trehalohydrolase [Brevibacterium]RBP67130.1 maltooligosyl trehalose hydrolase [Brevibacterium sanguinis]RBP73655.1 maltooligosyl trehalose hydrolase [Brevibacterium celere]
MTSDTEQSPFAVWAPRPETVSLLADGVEHPMRRDENGWWTLSDPEVAAGLRALPAVDYGYLLDGASDPLPDPRSRRQPAGVHSLSRTYDAAAFAWTDADWAGRELAGGLIYELHIGTFTPEGTFDAAIGRLEHLRSLGVDFVELLPVNAFNGTHNWGYDGVLWYAVHEQYGGPEGHQRFVDACHRHGLGVIQDVVYNHLGPSGNHLPRFGPYLHTASVNTWGDSVNLDGPDSDEVRRYIVDNALMWLRDHHVDGLRLDAVHALVDSRAIPILEELAAAADELSDEVGRPLSLIAESDLNDPRLITPRDSGGCGLTGQWSDDFHHAVHVAVTGETTGYYADFDSLAALAKVLTRGFFHDNTYSSFRRRHHGREIDTERTPAWRLVVCTQNHDQIGNRAAGDRLSATVDEGGLAIAATLNLLGPFTPMLFMGEEWAASTPWQFFTSHPEPDLGAATAEGRLREFAAMGWDESVVPNPQDETTFTDSTLDWDEATSGDHARMLALYRRLGRLRREIPELRDQRFQAVSVRFDEDERWLVLCRGGVQIAVNFGVGPVEVPLPLASGGVLLSTAGAGAEAPADDARESEQPVILPGRTATVFRPSPVDD